MPSPKPRHRPRPAGAAAVAAAIAVMAGALAAPPPALASSDTPAGAEPTAVSSHTVTLITGDTVTTTVDASGREAVSVSGATGDDAVFTTRTDEEGHLHVVPESAEPLLADGTFDPGLFDVTRLVDDGYDDARSAELPVIVDYRDTPTRDALTGRTDALPGAEPGVAVEAIGAGAAQVDKDRGEAFTSAVARSSDIAKVWLDGKVTASLDVSVPHIGADKAWAAGYDGKGVKVAVLDTGLDLNHPDVKDRVVAARSFVPGVDSVQDGHGHGTHVASTIAGSGAASGGRYQGVAPQAALVIGKVLNDRGQGSESSVLAGMQWAAGSGARVVSMSLGAGATDGTDPMSRAVDELSDATGALFVVSAGNSGPRENTIGSPGAAASALTVAAYSKTDTLAGFSSRGPRAGDGALKPEIAAPGVDIVAARAAGTVMGTPVDASYTSASGTSMAAPHVSGAAAILAQRHPDWSWQRLKDSLMSTSVWIDGDTPYEQGAGRVDVAAALAQSVTPSGKADFGEIRWQEGTRPTRTRTVTYTNSGDTDIRLALDVRGIEEDAFSLAATDLTVPAGGSVQTTLTFDPNAVPTGPHGGVLTATTPDGTSAHTVLAAYSEPARHDLTLTLKDRNGKTPYATEMMLQSEDGTVVEPLNVYGSDTAHYRLPAGRYSVIGSLDSTGPDSASPLQATDLFALPSVDLRTQDRELTVDAREARDLALDITDESRPLERSSFSVSLSRDVSGAAEPVRIGMAGLLHAQNRRFGAIASGEVPFGSLNLSFWETDREPVIRAAVERPEESAEALEVLVPLESARFAGGRKLEPVDAGGGSAAELAAAGVAGKLAVIAVDSPTWAPSEIRAAQAAGAAAVMLTRRTPGALGVSAPSDTKVPVMAVGYEQGQRLLALARSSSGPVTVRLDGVLESTYTYQAHRTVSGIPADPAVRASRERFAVEKAAFHTEVAGRPGTETRHSWDARDDSRSVRMNQQLRGPVRRTDYLLAAPGVTYQQMVQQLQGMPDYLYEPARAARADSVHETSWYAAPSHPSVYPAAGACSYCRTQQGLNFSPPLQGDSDPTHYGLVGPRATWSYYRDGERVAGKGDLLVEDPAAGYRVVLDTKRWGSYPADGLAPTVHTEWSFRAAKPAGKSEALPVLLIGYRLPVDTANRAPAGGRFAFEVSAVRPAEYAGGVPVSSLAVEVSYDNGATWHLAEVGEGKDGAYRVSADHPALADTDGYVSLRVRAADADGNSTVQVVEHAYRLVG